MDTALMRFQVLKAMRMKMTVFVLKAMRMKMTVFWDVAPCNLIENDQHFKGAHFPEDGGSRHL
jgi:hypothetical protein